MKVNRINQDSGLQDRHIRWYLFEEQLWATKYGDYSEVENRIPDSAGSFNWLYEINDTMLFRENGIFETAIIGLSGKINVSPCPEYAGAIQEGEKGTLRLEESGYSDFEFPAPVMYAQNEDILFSVSENRAVRKLSAVLITDDFGFIISGEQLEGWFLKRASRYIYIGEENDREISPDILARYLTALKKWDQHEDSTGLKELLDEEKRRKISLSRSFKEHIRELL